MAIFAERLASGRTTAETLDDEKARDDRWEPWSHSLPWIEGPAAANGCQCPRRPGQTYLTQTPQAASRSLCRCVQRVFLTQQGNEKGTQTVTFPKSYPFCWGEVKEPQKRVSLSGNVAAATCWDHTGSSSPATKIKHCSI